MTSSFTYAPTTHNLNTVTSAGVTTTNTHNSAGLLTQSVSTGGGQKQKTSATYDSYGQKTSSTDVNNTTTSYDRSYYTGHHISGITEGSLKQKIYTVGGQLLDKVKQGINIVRNANGKTQKVTGK